MTKTVYRSVGSKRYSPRPKKMHVMAAGTYDEMLASLGSAQARLNRLRKKR